MERWLEALQKIGKIMPLLMAVCLVLGVAVYGVYQWQKPVLVGLQIKDPYRYELMVSQAQRLRWIDAWSQYEALRDISPDELYRERYVRWRHQWATDGEFRQNALRQKADIQKQLRQLQKEKYAALTQELEHRRLKQKTAVRKVHWEQATPWQKSMILRDGCVRFLSQEIEDHRRRRHVKGTLHGESMLTQSRIAGASPGSLCREMVSLSHDEPSVRRALLNLKEGMNYYYFVRLLTDAGIPDSEWFTVSDKLQGMTRDF